MRLRREIIEYLSSRIIDVLSEKELIDIDSDRAGAKLAVVGAISADLAVEDALNNEVKEILDAMGDEMENIDYRKMFQMVKSKLARERGLIL